MLANPQLIQSPAYRITDVLTELQQSYPLLKDTSLLKDAAYESFCNESISRQQAIYDCSKRMELDLGSGISLDAQQLSALQRWGHEYEQCVFHPFSKNTVKLRGDVSAFLSGYVKALPLAQYLQSRARSDKQSFEVTLRCHVQPATWYARLCCGVVICSLFGCYLIV